MKNPQSHPPITPKTKPYAKKRDLESIPGTLGNKKIKSKKKRKNKTTQPTKLTFKLGKALKNSSETFSKIKISIKYSLTTTSIQMKTFKKSKN